MKQRFLLSACLLLTMLSCRNDFTLEGEYQDIPVAYAYFDAADDRHFVRVEKAFLESGGNAVTNAGIADSIYYGENDATVVLKNLSTNQEQEMERVDAEDFFRSRADGIFATNPNIAYTVTNADLLLRAGDQIELLIERPGEDTAVATTTMLQEVNIIRPNDQVRIALPNRPVIMSWTKGEEASIYDIRIFFNIRELFPMDASMNRDVRLEWNIANAYVPGDAFESGQTVRLEVDPQGFYQFLGSNLEENSNIVRRFSNFDIQVAAAGKEVLELRNLANANSGITSSGSLPRYTNLVGGIGLITSNSSTIKEGILFDGDSLDSLQNGQFTRNLGFQ
ncbi:MAG: hypothetical protein ACJAZ9_001750 [Neolewinella sp.]|jgi:hypothetical protein